MGMEAKNLATVQAIYEAFGKGDVATILGAMAEDVAWESWPDNSAQKAGVPWMAGGTGQGAVIAFFQGVGAEFDIKDFVVHGFMAGGDMVAVSVTMDATIRSTGKHFVDDELHVWTLNADGKVTGLRHYIDTAKHIAAAKA